jgi:hypothetical protein
LGTAGVVHSSASATKYFAIVIINFSKHIESGETEDIKILTKDVIILLWHFLTSELTIEGWKESLDLAKIYNKRPGN